MKNQLKPTGTKLIEKFDQQLKNLIIKDLLQIRSAKNQLITASVYK